MCTPMSISNQEKDFKPNCSPRFNICLPGGLGVGTGVFKFAANPICLHCNEEKICNFARHPDVYLGLLYRLEFYKSEK